MTVARSFVWTSSPLFAVRTASQSPAIGRQMACIQIARQATVLLSIYRPLCRSRTGCSRIMSAKFDRNDPDRASSPFVVGYRVF